MGAGFSRLPDLNLRGDLGSAGVAVFEMWQEMRELESMELLKLLSPRHETRSMYSNSGSLNPEP